MIDLDSENPKVANKNGDPIPIFEYSNAEVQNQKAQTFIVRGSSRKEKIDLNMDLICYMLHGNSLRVWTDDDHDSLEYVLEDDPKITDITLMDENTFFFKKNVRK